MAEVASAKFVRQLQAKIIAMEAQIRRLQARQYPTPIIASGGGGTSITAVCTACQYDDVTHSLMITASRLLSIPYGYDPEPPESDKFTAWAGVDGMIIPLMHVKLTRIDPIPADTGVQYLATPILGADRTQLIPPSMECLTEFTEPCVGDATPDLCT